MSFKSKFSVANLTVNEMEDFETLEIKCHIAKIENQTHLVISNHKQYLFWALE